MSVTKDLDSIAFMVSIVLIELILHIIMILFYSMKYMIIKEWKYTKYRRTRNFLTLVKSMKDK